MWKKTGVRDAESALGFARGMFLKCQRRLIRPGLRIAWVAKPVSPCVKLMPSFLQKYDPA